MRRIWQDRADVSDIADAVRRRWRLGLLCLLALLTVLWVAAARGGATEDGLTLSLTAYYAALDDQRYEDVWAVMTPRLQQEEPLEVFVGELRRSRTRLRFKGPFSVTLREGDVPVATTRAAVTLEAIDGTTRDGMHETQWVWSQSRDSRDYRWLLMRQALVTK
jgi:hypothetical protein